jgi:MFS family permease
MVSYAIGCGVPAMAAVTIYSVEGLAGLGGRLLLGVLADRLGAKRVLVAGLLVQALAIPAYLLVRQLDEFYALALVFGAAYGGVMPLYAVLAREYFGPRIMGAVFGAATMASSIGMALGPLAGGWCSTPSAATPGSMSARSPSRSARSRWRSPSRRCLRPRDRGCSRREAAMNHTRPFDLESSHARRRIQLPNTLFVCAVTRTKVVRLGTSLSWVAPI